MKFTQKDDYKKFFLEIPDSNFSPERNKAVVENSIKKYEVMRNKKKHEYDDAYAERADAVVTYLKSFNKPGQRNIERFFSKNYLAYLRGLDIKRELYARTTFLKPNGEEIFNPFK